MKIEVNKPNIKYENDASLMIIPDFSKIITHFYSKVDRYLIFILFYRERKIKIHYETQEASSSIA